MSAPDHKTEDVFPVSDEPVLCKGKHGPHDLREVGQKVMSTGRLRCRACYRINKRNPQQARQAEFDAGLAELNKISQRAKEMVARRFTIKSQIEKRREQHELYVDAAKRAREKGKTIDGLTMRGALRNKAEAEDLVRQRRELKSQILALRDEYDQKRAPLEAISVRKTKGTWPWRPRP